MGSRAWGECQRSGKRVLLSQLVRDGYDKNLLVAPDEYDPAHPQLNLRRDKPKDEGVLRYPSPDRYPPPSAPVLTGISNDGVDNYLTWTSAIDNAGLITEYRIWRSVDGGPYTLLATTDVTRDWMGRQDSTNEYTDTDIGGSLSYYVQGVSNVAGPGLHSNIVTLTGAPVVRLIIGTSFVSGQANVIVAPVSDVSNYAVYPVTGLTGAPGVASIAYGAGVLLLTSYGSQNGVWRSLNNGQTWTQLSGQPANISGVAYGLGVWVLSTQDGNIYSSIDAGDTWTLRYNSGSDAFIGRPAFTIEDRFIAPSQEAGTVYSTDGINWSLIAETVNAVTALTPLNTAGTGGPTRLQMAFGERMHQGNNPPASFFDGGRPFTAPVYADVAYGPGTLFVAVGTDGATPEIHSSNNNAFSFTSRTVPATVTSMRGVATDGTTAFATGSADAGAGDNVVILTSTDGTTWSIAVSGIVAGAGQPVLIYTGT